MPARVDRPAVPPVDGPAMLAAPGVFCQGRDGPAERVIQRDAEPILVHARHHAAKVRPMVRATLQDVVLPLVNHFMRQGDERFALWIRTTVWQEDRRQSDATAWCAFVRCLGNSVPWSDPADKHPGRGGQATTPFNRNGRKGALKITTIEVGPVSEQRFGGGQHGVPSHC